MVERPPASHAADRGSIQGRDRPRSFKQVVTVQLPNARQQVRMSRVLRDYHYKGPQCSMTMSGDYRSTFAAVYR